MPTNSRSAHAAYQYGELSAAEPLRIVVLLYEGAIRFCRQAGAKLEDPAVRGHALGRAHRIVSELLAALDHERGGEIATRLDALYRYCLDAITRANVAQDDEALASVIRVLDTLLPAWRQIEAEGTWSDTSVADGALAGEVR